MGIVYGGDWAIMPVDWNPAAFTRQVIDNASARVTAICVSAVETAKTNMRRLGGGASSEPGDWPARQSGDLAKNITYEIDQSPAGVKGRFGILPLVVGGAELGGEERGYPYLLEVGTRRMLPRPWMTLTMDRLEGLYGITFERSMERAIARGVVRGLLGG